LAEGKVLEQMFKQWVAYRISMNSKGSGILSEPIYSGVIKMKISKYFKSRLLVIAIYIGIMTVAWLIISQDNAVHIEQISLNNMMVLLALAGSAGLLVDFIYTAGRYRKTEAINSEDVRGHSVKPGNPVEEKYQELLETQEDYYLEILRSERQKEEEVIDWLSVMVHRLKTPVFALSLIMEKQDEELKKPVEKELFRMKDDINKMLFYARGNKFTRNYLVETVDLRQLIDKSINKHSQLFVSRKITYDIQGPELSVLSDSNWLSFILDQMISNAGKFSHEGGKVIIAIHETAKEVRISVQDYGVGIKEEDIVHIFTPVFTDDNNREDMSVTGMGLYLANDLAKKLGHSMGVESRYGKGTTISIVIPKLFLKNDEKNVS
jgi:signal transduction histidine kinase